MSMSTATEREHLTEFIQLYRTLTCLWDTREVLYTNKEARDHAYEVLLSKYKSIHEDAAVMDVKKRIENMRCGYRREHKKVLRSRMNGDKKEYIPSLWYYEHFQFLNDVGDWSNLDINTKGDESMKIEYDNEVSPGQAKSAEKIGKGRRESACYGPVVPTIYLPELHSNDGMHAEEMVYNQEENNTTATATPFSTESEAFGATVGLQLRELDPLQRLIAEKLISDVIFNARLKKLTVDSCVVNLPG